jgi:hypothetical protein
MTTPAPMPHQRPSKIDTLMPMSHEFISDTIMENGVEGWAVFERRYSAKWILVARCPDEQAASTIVAHLNASVSSLRDRGIEGATCVSICSIEGTCELCQGHGWLDHVPGTNVYGKRCPIAKRLRKECDAIAELA